MCVSSLFLQAQRERFLPGIRLKTFPWRSQRTTPDPSPLRSKQGKIWRHEDIKQFQMIQHVAHQTNLYSDWRIQSTGLKGFLAVYGCFQFPFAEGRVAPWITFSCSSWYQVQEVLPPVMLFVCMVIMMHSVVSASTSFKVSCAVHIVWGLYYEALLIQETSRWTLVLHHQRENPEPFLPWLRCKPNLLWSRLQDPD